ncbi:MAG TPA: diaminopimelate decarboxylase [Labilithrix sp.]|nr:diaminopimelate decarboxylase [Labilithrix sp.]
MTRLASGELALGGMGLLSLSRTSEGGYGSAAAGAQAFVGTPTYVYDLDGMAREARALEQSFEGHPHLVAYAVKANSAGPIVRVLVSEGCGADVVSGAELLLAMRCGVSPERIVYSGVAKRDDELDLAVGVGDAGIRAINVESVEEVPRIAARAAAQGRVARVTLRINPGVDAVELDTHSYIATGHDEAKFGVPLASIRDAIAALDAAKSTVRLVGVTAHAGSQLTSTDAYRASARAVFETASELRKRFALEFVDTGGGFGIDYGTGCPVRPADFIREVRKMQREHGLGDLALYCEPGRALVGAYGLLLAKVIQRKVAPGDPPRRWLMIDAGMNDLMRPALYQARHRIVPVASPEGTRLVPFRVVGPVCESSDDFGVHDLPEEHCAEVALLDAGAYGYSMASRYNGRALPAEVFLRGGSVATVRPRKPMADWVDDRA